MKLNHINLSVENVPATRAFLERYLGLAARGGNANIAFLADDDGLVLSLMSPRVGSETAAAYPATFHVGFGQPNEEAVDELHHRLVRDGFTVAAPTRQHGVWGFYVSVPGGILIEVFHQPSATTD